jgi:putative transcriptional regulator
VSLGPVDDAADPRLEPAAGRLLIAAPSLVDPNFDRSVVLLLDHDEQGSLGVVLNRPTDLDVADVLPSWRDRLTGDPVVFKGGPVALDSALGLAAVPGPVDGEEPPGFRRVAGPLGLIDLDADPEVLGPALTDLRIFVGYAGWGPDQLAGELAEDAWFVVASLPTDAFAADAAGLWRGVLRRQPGELAWVANFPPDPTLN